nr:MAG TPA: hypothetical protein [Caudoviricetes sp.]
MLLDTLKLLCFELNTIYWLQLHKLSQLRDLLYLRHLYFHILNLN